MINPLGMNARSEPGRDYRYVAALIMDMIIVNPSVSNCNVQIRIGSGPVTTFSGADIGCIARTR